MTFSFVLVLLALLSVEDDVDKLQHLLFVCSSVIFFLRRFLFALLIGVPLPLYVKPNDSLLYSSEGFFERCRCAPGMTDEQYINVAYISIAKMLQVSYVTVDSDGQLQNRV